jgi:hypothetical protein
MSTQVISDHPTPKPVRRVCHDAVLGIGGHVGDEERQSSSCRPALVSRGSSYLKIVWNWVHYALIRGYALLATAYLSSEPDPEPAMASKKQDEKRRQSRFVSEYQEAA